LGLILEIDGGLESVASLLQDDDIETRRDTAVFLGSEVRGGGIDYSEPVVIDGLVKALGDGASEVRETACSALGDIFMVGSLSGDTNPFGDATEDAIAAVISLLGDENPRVRVKACNTLAYLGPRAGDAKETLISMLGDEDFLVRLGAATALATMEPDITEGIPVLIDGVMSAPADYRPPGVLPNIDWSYPADIRRVSAQALGLIGPPAIEAVPALIELFDYPGTDVQESATQAIASIAPSDQGVIELLERSLADDNPMIRGNAARTLGLIGPPAEGALPILYGMLGDEDKEVAGRVREAISRIERNDRVE